MSKEFIDASDFRDIILKKIPVIDVRAPVEFALGSIPGSVNLPILNNEERQVIGTTYKEQGQAAAVNLGYKLVSGDVKSDRVKAWIEFMQINPEALITCFRGGMRSQISQLWLSEANFQRPRLKGGYKAFRQFLLNELDRLSSNPIWVISGSTGSGKTLLIEEAQNFCSTVNLEFLAKHRGSAFGAYLEKQPSQSDFENLLASDLLIKENLSQKTPLLVEDESRMIGKIVQPEKFFLNLRESKMILIKESLENRVQIIFDEYILKLTSNNRTEDILNYQKAFQIISKKLGNLRFQEISVDLLQAQSETTGSGNMELHKTWIEKLLVWYYDPIYTTSLNKRKPRIIFQGTRKEALEFIRQAAGKSL